jgi:hypothetical protein
MHPNKSQTLFVERPLAWVSAAKLAEVPPGMTDFAKT